MARSGLSTLGCKLWPRCWFHTQTGVSGPALFSQVHKSCIAGLGAQGIGSFPWLAEAAVLAKQTCLRGLPFLGYSTNSRETRHPAGKNLSFPDSSLPNGSLFWQAWFLANNIRWLASPFAGAFPGSGPTHITCLYKANARFVFQHDTQPPEMRTLFLQQAEV